MKVILIAFIMLMQNAIANDCTPMNLVTEPNSPFRKIPIYDQDGINICYAYTAAQLIDYELVKAGQERSVHPLWAALRYAESKNKEQVSFGHTYYAVQEIQKFGNCEYNKVSNALGVWALKANVNEAEIMSLIERFAPKLKELYSDIQPEEAVTVQQIDEVINEALEEHKPFCSPGATWDQLMPELRSLSVMGSRQMLANLVLPVCNGALPKPKINPPKFFATEDDNLWSPTMQQKLDQLKAPISISYCSQVLYDPGFDGIERSTTNAESVKAENCGAHESLIVGKKKIGESCHFLLRNTWGSGFGKSTDNWKCLCKNKASGEMVDDCSESTHNNGEFIVEGCWIDSQSLGKNIFGMTSLEKKVPASKPTAPKKK